MNNSTTTVNASVVYIGSHSIKAITATTDTVASTDNIAASIISTILCLLVITTRVDSSTPAAGVKHLTASDFWLHSLVYIHDVVERGYKLCACGRRVQPSCLVKLSFHDIVDDLAIDMCTYFFLKISQNTGGFFLFLLLFLLPEVIEVIFKY